MAQTDALNALREPVLDLPLDLGDGPFLTAPADPDTLRARPASTQEYFRRTEPFEDNTLTGDSLFARPASHITIGRFHVSDMLRPNSFRRVYQTFSYRPSPDLEGTFEIRFTGAGRAITRQNAHARVDGAGALANAALALDDGALFPYPTLPAQATTFQIRLRVPGYEPNRYGGVIPPDIRCLDASSEYGRQTLRANTIVEFDFGNSGREWQMFPVPYPAGLSIPVIFDIVNQNPIHQIIVDFFVDVLIDRSAMASP